MELFTAATGFAITAVLIMTQLLKLVPVNFTKAHPAWVSGILSVVASCIIILPTFTFVSIGQTILTALLIAVTSALAYNQWASRLATK